MRKFSIPSQIPGTAIAMGTMAITLDTLAIPPVDRWLNSDVEYVDGAPVLETDADWVKYFGPRALSLGVSVGGPLWVQEMRNPKATPKQGAGDGGG